MIDYLVSKELLLILLTLLNFMMMLLGYAVTIVVVSIAIRETWRHLKGRRYAAKREKWEKKHDV